MNEVKSLPRSELEIIKAMWSLNEPVSAAQLNNHIQKGWRVQTLITHLARMVAKQVVTVEHRPATHGARYFYSPCIDKTEYINQETSLFIERLHDDNIKSVMDSMFSSGKIKKEDAQYLLSLFK